MIDMAGKKNKKKKDKTLKYSLLLRSFRLLHFCRNKSLAGLNSQYTWYVFLL
jgi:hypothetical protein